MVKLLTKQLEDMTQSKNQSYTVIARHLLDISDPDTLDNLRLKDIQDKCHVSSSTIIRFCKKLELSGFSEMKYRLSEHLSEGSPSFGSQSTVLNNLSDEHLKNVQGSFEKTQNLLTDKQLSTVIKLIEEAEIINLYAVGSTYLVARDFEIKLGRLKKFAKSFTDKNLQFFAAKNTDEHSLSIGISYSGESESVIESLNISKNQNAKTILITNEKNKQFEDEYTVVLYVGATDMRNRMITTTSRLSLLYLIDLLFFSYNNLNREEFLEILKHSSYM